jgi:hypothetical protein
MSLSSLLASLQVPVDFNRYDEIPDSDVLARLDQWKHGVEQVLGELKTRVQDEHASLSLEQQADIISATVVFHRDCTWTTPESQGVAQGVLT